MHVHAGIEAENAGLKAMLLKIDPSALKTNPELFQDELMTMTKMGLKKPKSVFTEKKPPHTPGAGSSVEPPESPPSPPSFDSTGNVAADPHRFSPDGKLARSLKGQFEQEPID